MKTNIIEFPTIEQIQEKVERLSEILSQKIQEKDFLIYIKSQMIEDSYILRLGKYEVLLQKERLCYLRLLKKHDFKEMGLTDEEISRRLFEELSEDESALKELQDRQQLADIRKRENVFSEEQLEELNTVYRSLLKKLHPSLNRSLDPEHQSLFVESKKFFQQMDLEELKIILEKSKYIEEKPLRGLKEWMDRKKKLESSISRFQLFLDEIQSEFPFTIEPILAHESLVQERIYHYREQIQEYRDSIEKLMIKGEDNK